MNQKKTYAAVESRQALEKTYPRKQRKLYVSLHISSSPIKIFKSSY